MENTGPRLEGAHCKESVTRTEGPTARTALPRGGAQRRCYDSVSWAGGQKCKGTSGAQVRWGEQEALRADLARKLGLPRVHQPGWGQLH